MKEGYLFEIFNGHVLKEGDKDEIVVVIKLTKRCLNFNGKKRPTMKEVAIELARLEDPIMELQILFKKVSKRLIVLRLT